VFNQPLNNQPIWDARPGIGTDKYVSNAQQDGLSTQREPVFQFLTTVINGMLQELVLPVIKDIVLFTDNAPNLLFNNQPIWDVKLGIGTNKFVSNAQQDGLSTQREFVFQFLTTVTNGMLQEPVLLVIKDTALLTDNVFNLPYNNQLIWDVKLGIGTDKFVLNAHPDGPSTQRVSVFQFLTTVINGMLQEPVQPVIKVMI